MGKYDAFEIYLGGHRGTSIEVSFQEIENIIGDRLPPSARTHRAWWSNEVSGNHVQARSWINAGWQVNVLDILEETVTFGPCT